MSEMIEKIALALWRAVEEAFPAQVQRLKPDAIDWATGAWPVRLKQARAVIELMAEGPTDEMTTHETYTSGQWSRRNYEAIFTAALSPSREDEGK